VGGDQVRVRLSNLYGEQPVTVNAAHIALGATGTGDSSAIVAGGDRMLEFGGKSSTTIAPGEVVASDPVSLPVKNLSRLVVSLYFVGATTFGDMHDLEPLDVDVGSMVAGDATDAQSFAGRKRLHVLGEHSDHHVYMLAGIDVIAPESTRGIVAFGDSITDGAYATGLASPWPEALAALADGGNGQAPVAVVNEGISGNELTADQIGYPRSGMSGLKRFEHDAIDQPGVTDVIVLLGTNDINRGIGRAGWPVGASAQDLIEGLRMLADVAHFHHLRIYAGTIPPFAGFKYTGWYTPQKEAVRERVNDWILHTHVFDGVIPFAGVLTGPYQPSPLAARQPTLPPGMAEVCAADGGLHPNDRGYEAMAVAAYNMLFDRHARAASPCGQHVSAPGAPVRPGH
ncbi:MAG: GDSL family lipase, partial [Rhodanobacteraceae bacterium]